VQAHELADIRLVFDDEHARGSGGRGYHRLFTPVPRFVHASPVK
jgi:hypothetical protein